MSKAVSFLYAGQTGLYVVKPGYSLETANLPREAFVFDSRWFGTVRILAKTTASLASLPSSTIPGYDTVRRVFANGSNFARIPFALVSAYYTNLEQNLPGVITTFGIVQGSEVFVQEIQVAGASTVTTTLLDFPDNPTSSTPGTAGTRRVRLSPMGIYVAVDPHEAVTASANDHLLHPDITRLPQAIATLSNSSMSHSGGGRWWRDYSVPQGALSTRSYVSSLAYNRLLFPNSTTVRVIDPNNAPHTVLVLK